LGHHWSVPTGLGLTLLVMPEAVYFRGRVVAGKRIGEKTYVRIDVYIDEGGRELAKYIGREVGGIAVVIENEGS